MNPVRSAGTPLTKQEWQTVGIFLGAGLVLRAVMMPATGHATDVGTFESWTLSLVKYGIPGFYGHAGFVDYPPGYMLILAAFGALYNLLQSHLAVPFDLLHVTVKAPAVAADLGLAYLGFLMARRTWSSRAALWTMGLFVFNPAVWFVSAYWGQADAVTAVFVAWAVYMMLTQRYEVGWILFAFAVLIKPQPIVALPVLVIWQLRTARQAWRLALVPVLGLTVAYLGTVFFAPDRDPAGTLAWLYDRYHTGTALYPYNSCNAFNLYSTRLDFWQPDGKLIPGLPGFEGWPQWAWGVAIVAAFVFAISVRAWRTMAPAAERSEREASLYLALFLSLLGLFMFGTRMHERYLFSALAFGPLIWNAGAAYRLVYAVLSGTFIINLLYSLVYLYQPSQDLAPWLVHPLSILNVLCLFVAAGAYLIPEVHAWCEDLAQQVRGPRGEARSRRLVPLAHEGLVGLVRIDYAILSGLTILTGALLYLHINRPAERIFDEIYYARSAQEYLHHRSQFEWTHPPLSKLILTVGAWLYPVDPVGARLMSALFGTLTVPLLYAFAKRLFGSTLASATAVGLLLTCGYFYVQSRIATPEIFVAFFALATIYCLYRLWIAAQIVRSRSGAMLPDGSRVQGGEVCFEFGERMPLRAARLTEAGQTTIWTADGARVEESGSALTWRTDATIEGRVGGQPVRDRQPWPVWLGLTCLAVACVIASKWNGLFDLGVAWLVAAAVTMQRRLPWQSERPAAARPPRRFVWGNAYGFRLLIFIPASLAVTAVVYLLTYIPFFQIGNANLGLHGTFHDFLALQWQMFHYHYDLKATHPYASKWWTWPLELRPVSYYYHVFSGTTPPKQIVAEVLALPNPFVWLPQLVTVPLTAVMAWRTRHKGMLLCCVAYVLQWLPWIASPRIDFQYNFYPNTALICLCGAYVLMLAWRGAAQLGPVRVIRGIILAYLAACAVSFWFFLPILNGTPITWTQWHARIWYDDGAPHPYGWI